MFLLAIIEDKLKIKPEEFSDNLMELLIEEIDMKYANKILSNKGFCISFYDFITIDDPFIYPAEGAAHQLAKFRIVIFRPFIGEIIVGKILSSNKDGIRVTLEFFDEIFIPASNMMEDTVYLEDLNYWCWNYDDKEYSMEAGQDIRFRVQTITFTKPTSQRQQQEQLLLLQQQAMTIGENQQQDAIVKRTVLPRHEHGNDSIPIQPPTAALMEIIATINDFGLGLTTWW